MEKNTKSKVRYAKAALTPGFRTMISSDAFFIKEKLGRETFLCSIDIYIEL